MQETGVGEITIEEDGMRVSVRRTAEQPFAAGRRPRRTRPAARSSCRRSRRATTRSCGSRARWSGRSTARPRRAPPSFVEEGDPVAAGQTLCILEAMKLMNEVKAEIEAVVRAIHVGNAEPVEYGQLLFELEPVNGRPLDAV